MRRTRRGELNVAALTREWLIWRRIECGGADMGGAHALNPRGPNNTFTLTQITEYRRWFCTIPRPVQCDLDGPRLGRHAHPMDRVCAQFEMLGKCLGTLNTASPFG